MTIDPQLSGQKFTLDGIKASELDRLMKRVGTGSGGVIEHLAKKNEKLSDIVDIKKFYAQMKDSMLTMDKRRDATYLTVGDNQDLPADYRDKEGSDTFAAQKRLQSAAVNYGGGGSDIDALEKWADNNLEDIWKLCEAYGEVPAASSAASSSFMLERIPGTGAYRRPGSARSTRLF